jgi:CRISPR-associated endonuclease Cas1
MIEHTLLINNPFALKQKDGLPVYVTREYEVLNGVKGKPIPEKIKKALEMTDEKKRSKILMAWYRSQKPIDKKPEVNKTHGTIIKDVENVLDLSKLERIIITPRGKGYISTAFLDFAKEYDIPIYFINNKRMVEACFMPTYFKRTSLVIKQCEARINGKNIDIAKYLISLKLESQEMKHLLPKLRKAKSIKDILQVEGNASRDYYQQWEFDNIWRFNGRHGKTSTNANAIDPINAMLNLGYTLLAYQMSETLLKRGYELSIGFMHNSETSKTYWNMLSYDFIEPYRIWIDTTVKEMIAENEIYPDNFKFSGDKNKMVFKNNSFKVALGRFTETLEPLERNALPTIRKIESML